MISFFRLNDPYRLIGVFILLVIFRIPTLLGFTPLTQPELGWMIVGENLSAGDTLYLDIWDNLAPLSAAFYWLVDELFGRSSLAYAIIAIVLTVVQAGIFNGILLNNKAFNENTYVPSLVYIVLANIFFDFFTISPVLLSLTFILLSFGNIFRIISGKYTDETLFFLGLNIGIAALFFLPSIAFLIAFAFSLLIFTGTKVRQYLLLIIGLVLPIAFVVLYYIWKEGFAYFYLNYVQSINLLDTDNYIDLLSILILAAIPAIFLLLGIYKFNNTFGFNNYQVRLQQAIFYCIIAAAFAFAFSAEKSAYHLILFLPSLTFYVSHYFLLIRNRAKAELFFFLFFVLILVVNYGIMYRWLPYVQDFVKYEDILIKDRPEKELVAGKKIIVLGQDLSLYEQALLATPYLEWELASYQLTELNYYDNMMAAFRNFKHDMPQVIVDDVGIIPDLFAQMPTINSRYQPSDRYPHVYILQESKKND